MNHLSATRTELGLNRATQRKILKILWAAVGVFFLYICALDMTGLIPPGLSAITITILLVAIAVLHGTIGYRARDFAVFFPAH